MKHLPARKHTRFQTFDYSSNGLYFLTICTHEQQCLFSHVVGALHEAPAPEAIASNHVRPNNQAVPGRFVNRPYEPAHSPATVGALHEAPASEVPIRCELTPYGEIVELMLYMLPLQFETVRVTDHIIMPNHVHMILELSRIEDLRAIHESTLRDDAQKKRSELSKIVGYFKMQSSKRIHEIDPTVKVWQRGYYDHIIRDDADYKTKAEYIATNPLRWLHREAGESYR